MEAVAEMASADPPCPDPVHAAARKSVSGKHQSGNQRRDESKFTQHPHHSIQTPMPEKRLSALFRRGQGWLRPSHFRFVAMQASDFATDLGGTCGSADDDLAARFALALIVLGLMDRAIETSRIYIRRRAILEQAELIFIVDENRDAGELSDGEILSAKTRIVEFDAKEAGVALVRSSRHHARNGAAVAELAC